MILASGVDDVTRDAARRAAREELLNRRYHDAQPPLVVRLVGKLIRKLIELIDRAATGVPGGLTGLLLFALVIGGLVALVVVKLRPTRGHAGSADVFTTGAELTAEAHRALADEAAATGQFADAVRERLRAIVRELEARGVIEPRPGRTAGEVARDGSAAVPLIAGALQRATTTFDEIWYGGRGADASSYAVLVECDRTVSSARLVAT
ncbi:MAG: hypothetical protein QOI82_3514 [Actinomycetota bacterium]|nr:hypothetical protein [Actinomycetota bacterium]